jgi:hypothetical protein
MRRDFSSPHRSIRRPVIAATPLNKFRSHRLSGAFEISIWELKPQSIAARQRAILVAEIRQIRPLLKSLVGLDLHGDEPSHWPALIAAWKDAYRQGAEGLTPAMAPPKSPTWDPMREDPTVNERNTAEVQLLWELRQALRRRTVHIPSSLSFQSRAKMLDPRGSSIRAPRSDHPIKTMLRELVEEIAYGLQCVSEAPSTARQTR